MPTTWCNTASKTSIVSGQLCQCYYSTTTQVEVKSKLPMPAPVPPPREWHSWKPCKQSLPKSDTQIPNPSPIYGLVTLLRVSRFGSKNLMIWKNQVDELTNWTTFCCSFGRPARFQNQIFRHSGNKLIKNNSTKHFFNRRENQFGIIMECCVNWFVCCPANMIWPNCSQWSTIIPWQSWAISKNRLRQGAHPSASFLTTSRTESINSAPSV